MKPQEIYAAMYEVGYRCAEPQTVAEAIRRVLEGDALFVTKKVKHGRKKFDEDVDILPNVITYALTTEADTVSLKILATAEQNNTLNIFLFAGALEKTAAFDYEARTLIKRCVVNENYRYFK